MADTIVILNSRAGTIRDRQPKAVEAIVEQAFATQGKSVEIQLAEGDAFIQRIDAAVKSSAGTIIVGGGDGSVSYAARKLSGSDRTLGLLPLGTMNLFARSLGIPSEIEAALAVLAKAKPQRIDLAAVNGRIFHSLAGLGYFAEVARARAQVRDAVNLPFGRYIAAARASFRAFTKTGVLRLTLESEQGTRSIDAYALLVTNNRLSATGFERPRLDEGLLELHFAEGVDIAKRMQAGLDLIAGRWRDNPEIESFTVKKATVSSHRPRLWLSVDGELTRVKTPLVFESLPRALSVLVPAKD